MKRVPSSLDVSVRHRQASMSGKVPKCKRAVTHDSRLCESSPYVDRARTPELRFLPIVVDIVGSLAAQFRALKLSSEAA
jgi:hypothetical protein